MNTNCRWAHHTRIFISYIKRDRLARELKVVTSTSLAFVPELLLFREIRMQKFHIEYSQRPPYTNNIMPLSFRRVIWIYMCIHQNGRFWTFIEKNIQTTFASGFALSFHRTRNGAEMKRSKNQQGQRRDGIGSTTKQCFHVLSPFVGSPERDEDVKLPSTKTITFTMLFFSATRFQ